MFKTPYQMGEQMAELHKALKVTYNPEDVALTMYGLDTQMYLDFIDGYSKENEHAK